VFNKEYVSGGSLESCISSNSSLPIIQFSKWEELTKPNKKETMNKY